MILKPSLTRWEHLPRYISAHVEAREAMPPAIDRAELARQTFDDPALAAEILSMFAAQAPPLVQALRAATGQARADVAHRLKGSALAIGAPALADAAAALETEPSNADGLLAVETACDAVLAEIAVFGRASGG